MGSSPARGVAIKAFAEIPMTVQKHPWQGQKMGAGLGEEERQVWNAPQQEICKGHLIHHFACCASYPTQPSNGCWCSLAAPVG